MSNRSIRRSIRGTKGDSLANARKNVAARKKLTDLELLTGMTREQYEAFHAAQRERVRARLGLAA